MAYRVSGCVGSQQLRITMSYAFVMSMFLFYQKEKQTEFSFLRAKYIIAEAKA